LHGAGAAGATTAAVDAAGHIYVAGWFKHDLAIGTPPLASDSDVFVAKYASDGKTVLWARALGHALGTPSRVIVGADGGPVVAGVTGGTGSDDFADMLGDVFVDHLDADGGPVYASTFACEKHCTVTGLVTQASGNAVVTGLARGPITLDKK